MDWYGSHDLPQQEAALLPTPDYGLLVFDQGWNTMTMLGGRIRPRTRATPGLLEIYLTWPWSVTGPHKAEHVMQHPEFCGMLVSHALHAALMDWNKKQSPFWFFQLPSWQREKPVDDIVFEAANPPRSDNHALLASSAAAMNMLFPRATVHQSVMRQAVMRHFGIPVGKGRKASKEGSLQAVHSLIQQGRLEFIGESEPLARHLLSLCDHVCDALLQMLYMWGHLVDQVVVHGPLSDAPYEPQALQSARFQGPPSWRPVQ